MTRNLGLRDAIAYRTTTSSEQAFGCFPTAARILARCYSIHRRRRVGDSRFDRPAEHQSPIWRLLSRYYMRPVQTIATM